MQMRRSVLSPTGATARRSGADDLCSRSGAFRVFAGYARSGRSGRGGPSPIGTYGTAFDGRFTRRGAGSFILTASLRDLVEGAVPSVVHSRLSSGTSRNEALGVLAGPLSPAQVGDFVERGWTILQEGFPPSVATSVRSALGQYLNRDLDGIDDGKRLVWLQEAFRTPPYVDALTPRFRAAVDQLVGIDRWEMEPLMGWWPITFPGYDDPASANWHVEGSFRHHVTSPEQAVLNLFCFSTVEPGSGGTRLIEGSHVTVARLLWEAEPTGLEPHEIWPVMNRLLDRSGWAAEVEVCAEAGDVVLGHPLLYHSSNVNHGARPRVMAQPTFDMTEPKRTSGDDLSPVELAILRGRRTPP
jgi:Phytanoyl-CoA dioxygenase (PhyH)